MVPFESPGISHLMPCGIGKIDRVREAEREVERRALHLGAITGAASSSVFVVALGGALHHAGDERANEPLQARAVAAGDGSR